MDLLTAISSDISKLVFTSTGSNVTSNQSANSIESDEAPLDPLGLPAQLRNLVKISPTCLEFCDVFEGETYTLHFTIQNISTNIITLQIQQTSSTSFVVSDQGKIERLSTGLSTVRSVSFTCSLTSPAGTTIPIQIESYKWELPVIVSKGKPWLEVEPHSLDLGCVNIFSPPVNSWIKISNKGACPVRYFIDVSHQLLEMSAHPNRGRLKANDSQKIRLQVVPTIAGYYSTQFWLKGGNQVVMMQLQLTVVVPQLICNHPNTTGDFTLIDFPPTFLGAMRYETIVTSNYSAEPATFILLAEIRNEVLDLKAARKKNINYNMFTVSPSEGKICSMEGKIFTCIFKPQKRPCVKGWKSAIQPKEMDYLCFVRIILVQVSDHGTQASDEESGSQNDGIKRELPADANWAALKKNGVPSSTELLRIVNKLEGLRLCLHGVLVNPILTIVPDALYYTEIEMGKEEIRVIKLTNSSSIRFGYRYKRIPYVDVIPKIEYIDAGKSLEITVKVIIHSLGNYKNNLYFELLSSRNMTDKEGLIVIGKASITVNANVKTVTKRPKPKLNLGITPELTHEVGFLPEEVTFQSADVNVPRNAVVPVGGRLPKIHSCNATVAFPNDMPKNLWSHYPGKDTRSLFTGMKRYEQSVDREMAYTEEEREKIKMHKDFFTNYIRETANKLRPKLKKKVCDYDVSCKKLYQYDSFKPPPLQIHVPIKSAPYKSGQSLVPLTPLELYNIKITPRELNFEQVAVNTDCEELMYVQNLNSFLILIRILPGHSGVHIKGNEKIKVDPRATGAFKVVLHTNTLGKYNGSFKYVINENHVFEMPVSGEIVQKILVVEPEEVVFGETKDNVFSLWYRPVLLKNPLKTSTIFTWVLPETCKCFRVSPMSGKVPSLSKMYCAIYFFPSFAMEYTMKLTLKIESGLVLTVKCTVLKTRPEVFFINPVLNVGNIPLKLPLTVSTVLFNASYFEVPFEIRSEKTTMDVLISPSKGFIYPRGCIVCTLTFSVLCVGTIDKTFSVQSLDCTSDLRVVGLVVFPQLTLTPRELRLQRIRCFSYVSCLIVAVNTCATVCKISFLMEKYVQFKMSLSSKHWEEGLVDNNFVIKPGETQKFYLHFVPKDLATYEFYLPIKINDVIGPPIVGLVHSMKASSYMSMDSSSIVVPGIETFIPDQIPYLLVECTVAPAKLLFNKISFNFEKWYKRNMVEDELIFTNPQNCPAIFSIGSMKSKSPFTLTFKDTGNAFAKEKGFLAKLQPKESMSFTVKFVPPDYGFYEDVCLVAIKEMNQNFSKTPYNYIRFQGVYRQPALSCSSSTVFFPTIPLQMEGLKSLYITASDYEEEDELEIHNLGKTKEMQKLTFNFIEGNTIPVGSKSCIPFNLSFSSTEAISFKIQVKICDKNGRSTSFTVIASADNCIISTHAILVAKPTILTRVKFIDTDFFEAASSDTKCMSTSSAATTIGLKVEENHLTKVSPTTDGSSGNTVDVILPTTAQSITASLLMKQTIPTRFVHYFGLQDYVEGTDHTKMVRKAVERFFYEQVFHCSYHWNIGKNIRWSTSFKPAVQGAAAKNATLIKSIIEILERCYGKDIRTIFGQTNITFPQEENARVEKICSTLQTLLNFLTSHGAFLSHVEPRYLLDYDDFIIFSKIQDSVQTDINNPDASFGPWGQSSDHINGWYEVTQEPLTIAEEGHHGLTRVLNRIIKIVDKRSSASHLEIDTYNRSEYQILTTQCWLDVLLQIYKTLVLDLLPVTTKSAGISDREKEKEKYPSILKDKKSIMSQPKKRENMKMNISDVFREKVNHNIYGRAEICVLAWLNSYYDKQRSMVWGPDRIPEAKIINNFVDSLADCLVFAAVTAAYCPCITEYFSDMFTKPLTKEEVHHNAVCVTRAWQAIRIGFTVYPADFKKPNSIFMLMLSVHLYKILPSYLPETVVKFSTPLTSDTEHVIPLTNNSNTRIVYSIHIIGDPYEFFRIDNYQPLIFLKPKEKHSINIKFSARKTKTVTATLLLCGCCVSPFFGVNRVFTLEGFASELQTSFVFNLTATLNKLTTINLPIVPPFILNGETVFDIWYAEKKPTTDNFEAVPWSDVCLRKAPRRLYLSCSKISFSGSDTTKVEIKIGCFTPKLRYFWLVFMNEYTGDFIVQIAVKPRIKDLKEVINVELMDKGKVMCLCLELNSRMSGGDGHRSSCPTFSWSKLLSPSCPWRTIVKVPSRNNDLWHAVKTMFELALEQNEREFWSSHLETNIGLKLVQWMVGEELDSVTEEISHIFHTSVNYNVSCSSNYISFPPILHIPDVRLCNNVDLLAHISPEAPDQFVSKLTLTAEHKKEIRIYNINFNKITNNFSVDLQKIT